MISRSALINGIWTMGASRSCQSVDLPEPLWPASTNAIGRLTFLIDLSNSKSSGGFSLLTR